MKSIWGWSAALSFFVVLYAITAFFDPQGIISGEDPLKNQHTSTSFESGEKVILVMIDGLNESIFSDMLSRKELPNFSSLLEKNNKGIPKGIYTSITSDVGAKQTFHNIFRLLPFEETYKMDAQNKSNWEAYFSEHDPITEDFSKMVNYLAFVTPKYDYKLESYRAFNGLDQEVIGKGPGKIWQSYLIFKNRWSIEKHRDSLPRFSYVHLQSPGVIGNLDGYTDNYRESISKIDLMLGGMLDLLSRFKLNDELTIIISSTQGIETLPLGKQRQQIEVPLLISGSSLDFQKASYKFKSAKFHSAQLFPTIMSALREDKKALTFGERTPSSKKEAPIPPIDIWY